MNHPLKYHGGKSYLANDFWSIAEPILPTIEHVVETHCGGCSFTLEGLVRGYEKSFVVNDISRHLTNFWQVIRHDHTYEMFRKSVESTPFSEIEWKTANGLCNEVGWNGVADDGTTVANVARAVWFFVNCRQSMAGRMDSFAPLSRNRTRRGMNEQVSAWLTSVDGLPEIHKLWRKVAVLNGDANKVIKQQDGKKTLFFVDPPYIPDTRESPEVYEHEMTVEQHGDLLNTLAGIEGKFMLCGYFNEQYHEMASLMNWQRHDFNIANHSSSKKTKDKKVESLWTNW